jgi:hypothetical protein
MQETLVSNIRNPIKNPRCLLWWCSFLFTKKEGSQNYQVDSSNGWVYFKTITLTIFPSRPQENLNIGYLPTCPFFAWSTQKLLLASSKSFFVFAMGFLCWREGQKRMGPKFQAFGLTMAINEETIRPMLQIIFGLC